MTGMVLTGKTNPNTRFTLRELRPGRARTSPSALKTLGDVVTGLWRLDRDRDEFFKRFAEGIDRGVLRAKVVLTGPANLASLKSDRERADVYLKAAEKGMTISFDKVPDLGATEFMRYAEYFPD